MSRYVVTGVLNKHSIAWEVARQCLQAGDEVLLTGFGRTRRMTERAARALPAEVDVVELDVNEPGDVEALAREVADRWGGLDGVLHAIAFAPEDALGGNFLTAPSASAELAFRTSAYSFKALACGLADLLAEGEGGGVVGLDFDATVAWPVYDWMGVAKAALEAVSRYLARDLGPRGIAVNLVSAGPIETLAAGGIPGFDDLAAQWQGMAPLGWDPGDPAPVAEAVRFLLRARGITGEVVHVDGGYHAMGAPVVGSAVHAKKGSDPFLAADDPVGAHVVGQGAVL